MKNYKLVSYGMWAAAVLSLVLGYLSSQNLFPAWLTAIAVTAEVWLCELRTDLRDIEPIAKTFKNSWQDSIALTLGIVAILMAFGPMWQKLAMLIATTGIGWLIAWYQTGKMKKDNPDLVHHQA